jgi:hypothetical protein
VTTRPGYRDLPRGGWGKPPALLTPRGRFVAYAVMFLLAGALGACAPLWDAMPWAVTP